MPSVVSLSSTVRTASHLVLPGVFVPTAGTVIHSGVKQPTSEGDEQSAGLGEERPQ